MDEALYWKKINKEDIRCELCPFECLILNRRTGQCKVRINIDGKLFSKNFLMISGLGFDPVEKKPLYHFFPGSIILSIGTIGCNFHCQFCQNADISQTDEFPLEKITAEELLEESKRNKSIGIAFTYSEPSVWIETVFAVAPLFKNAGFNTAMITNGYINPKPLADIAPLIDAMNIDVKSFRNEYYRNICGGRLDPVLKNIEYLVTKTKVFVELTMLIVPGLNDSEKEIEDFCKWVSNLRKDIPVHFSRYFPRYKMKIPSTPEETLIKAARIAEQYLYHVYTGNTSLTDYSHTFCSSCKNLLIKRHSYNTEIIGIKDGKCIKCGTPLSGRF